MAKNLPTPKKPAAPKDDNLGYAGTGDHASGKVPSDPNQATPAQIKKLSQ